MKAIIASLLTVTLLAVSGPSAAQYHRPGPPMYRQWHPDHGWVWVVPTLIGGVIGYEIAKQQPPVVVQQPPIVIQQPPPPPSNEVTCTEWKDIQTPDGRIYRERTCRNN